MASERCLLLVCKILKLLLSIVMKRWSVTSCIICNGYVLHAANAAPPASPALPVSWVTIQTQDPLRAKEELCCHFQSHTRDSTRMSQDQCVTGQQVKIQVLPAVTGIYTTKCTMHVLLGRLGAVPLSMQQGHLRQQTVYQVLLCRLQHAVQPPP
jgi:hypothetical protein